MKMLQYAYMVAMERENTELPTDQAKMFWFALMH